MKKLICKICNRKCTTFSGLSNHIIRIHNLTPNQYFDKYLKSQKDGICKTCQKQTKFRNLNYGYEKYCNTKCAQNNPEVRKKYEKTCLENFGETTNLKNKECIEKIKKTNLKKYGVDNPFKSEEIKDKIRMTCLKKYGVDNPNKSKDIQKKKIQNSLKKYGVESPNQDPLIKKRKRRSFLKNWGVNCPFQSEIIQQKSKDTSIKKYGVPSYSQTIEARELFRKNCIERIEKQRLNGDPLLPCIGKFEEVFFNFLEKLTPYEILKQQKMFGYFPDGYIKELNLVIEFDENWHNETWAKRRDKIKNETYKKYNMNIFRVSQKEFEDMREEVKEHFLIKIRKLTS